jgi:ABC-type lipoprotein release transport system permease subunit
MRYAWRNLWRNGKRTSVTVAAVALNTAILIVTYALMDGILERSVRNVTNLVAGEVQIHAAGYLADRSLYKSLVDPQAILQALESYNIGAVPRSYGYGLVSCGTKSAGALFWGVEPALEQRFFGLARHIQAGRFLSAAPRREIMLGKKLAHSLNAKVGSEIVVVVQAADGSLGNDLYTVTGIFKTAGDNIDRSGAFLHIADFDELFVLGGRIHEIALNSQGRFSLPELASLAGKIAPGAEVKTWRELLPAFADMVNLSDVSISIFGAIFFLAAGLGVMNTMLMATYERIHEFGVLKALGSTPWRIIRDVTAEALVMSGLATTIGTVIGIAGAYYLQVIGLDTSVFVNGEISFAGVAFDPVWRASLSLKTVIRPVVIMWFICVVASLYPAAVAARMKVVQAIQHV